MQKIIMIPIVLIALTFHELSHGFISSKLGDPTPRLTGRLTINPLAHLDPIGAVLMVLTGFGWAKPVQINPRYYKNPKRGMAITAAAGPLSNLLMAFIAMLIYTAVIIIGCKTGQFQYKDSSVSYFINSQPDMLLRIMSFISLFASVNLCFMVFNLIPIPPLDGSRVLGLFLSNSAYFKLQQYERYSFILIIVLSLSGVFSRFIGTGVGFFMELLTRMSMAIVGLVV
ncbi:MAG: site-2 protease family protein [Oscillospiraceae bacterium]|nr:site-2 protease family protein [Oscillospiraceae bacterium]